VHNPLSYYERVRIVSAALLGAGLGADFFTIVPFPIEVPGSLRNYVETSVICYTTVYEEWNKEKIAMLKQHGYRVEVLWEGEEKEVEGGTVRQYIMNGDAAVWTTLVPDAVVPLVQECGLGERLMRLSSG
jgi:hypothetical protein